jgi:predicted small lipoprotein YifL
VKTLVLLLIPLAPLAACGRAGFDELPPPADVAPDAPPPVLSCDAAPRFMSGTTTTRLAATSTQDGYLVLSLDGNGQITGSSFQFSATDPMHPLTQATASVPIMSDANSVAAFAIGGSLFASVPFGKTSLTGTKFVSLDPQLMTVGTPTMSDGWYSGAAMLARGTASNFALLAQSLSTGEVDVGLFAADSTQLIPTQPVIQGSPLPANPTIISATQPGGTARFLVSWNAPGSPDAIHAQVLDDQLIPRTAVTKISADPTFGSQNPRAAYAPGADRYLFAWSEKVGSGMDQVWLSLRDGNLAEVVPPIKIAAQGVLPVIAAGDDSFLVVWQDGGDPYRLGAARVAKDGTNMALGIPTTGGTTAGWDLVVHDGQPALVWVEANGTGPNLWLDPLCH